MIRDISRRFAFCTRVQNTFVWIIVFAAILINTTLGEDSSELMFYTDFENGLPYQITGGGFLTGAQGYSSYGFGSYLCRSYGGTSTLTLTNLPTHQSIDLNCFFAAIDSWDGYNNGSGGTDYFNIAIDGRSIFSDTFDNAHGGSGQGFNNPEATIVQRQNLGFSVSGYHTDSAYDLGKLSSLQAVPHTSNSLTIQWYPSGNGWQGGDDESYAIDNVSVTLNGVSGPINRVSLANAYATDLAYVQGTQLLPSVNTNVLSLEIRSGGRLNMNPGDHLTVPGGLSIARGGMLFGSGTITGDVENSGSIQFAGSGGNSTGSFLTDGDFTQTAGAQSLFDIAGYTQSTLYDYFHITGTAKLEGSIVAALQNGFKPANNSKFDILTADGGIQFGNSSLATQLPLGFSWSLVNNNKTLELLYALGIERHYAGSFNGTWESTAVWSDRFGSLATGASVPTFENPVFINHNSVNITQFGQQAKSLMVNGGKLVVDGTTGGSLTVAENLELGNSTHRQTSTGIGQGWMKQVQGSQVTVEGDMVVGGKDSVYEIADTSRLNVKGSLSLIDGTNALFRQLGGTVIIGSTFDSLGHSTDGLLDLGKSTTYEMDGGILDVATINQRGLFVFKGGQLYVKNFLINTTPDAPQPTYTPAPAPVYGAASPPASTGGGYSTPSGGFTLERGIVVLDQNSDWHLTGDNSDLTIGQNSGSGSNGSFVQSGGTVSVDGELVIGDGIGGKGNYAMSAGQLTVHGQAVLGRNGGQGQFDQTGGNVTIDGRIIINESSSELCTFNLTAGTMHALGLSVGANGGPGHLSIAHDASVFVTEDVFIGQFGRVTGNGHFNITGAQVINNGLIEPGNSPGIIEFGADFTQGATGTLHMEFAGADVAGQDYDQLLIDGNVALDGTLLLDFLEGYAPLTGDTYELIAIGDGHQFLYNLDDLEVKINGLCSGWQYSLAYDQTQNAIILYSLSDGVTSIPEPATLLLLGLGGLVLRKKR